MVTVRGEQQQERIAQVMALAEQNEPDSGKSAYDGFSTFIQLFFEDATQDETESYDSHTLFQMALSFWRFSTKRKPGQALLRVFNPTQDDDHWRSSNTILQLVCDDMPFLVDSLLGELSEQDLNLHVVLHPVVQVVRDNQGKRTSLARTEIEPPPSTIRESMIQVEFDHHSEEKVIDIIRSRIETVIHHVTVVVADFDSMITRMSDAVQGLQDTPPAISPEELDESIAFLYWLRDNHFAFLGSRIYRFEGEIEGGDLVALPDSGLGILRDPKTRVLRRGKKLVNLTAEVREFLMLPAPIIITKANVRSDVHRRVHMDYIGIKLFDARGKLTGECRFVGLFTADAYNRSTEGIPLLSRKVKKILHRSGFSPDSYNHKTLKNILEIYPRDELFQVTEDEILRTAMGILDLGERPRTRVFIRNDRYDRYVSALVYVPRDRYDSQTRERIADILTKAYKGRLSAYYPYFNDSRLARVHFIIGLDPDDTRVTPDPDDLERAIIEVTRNWSDDLKTALVKQYGEEQSRPLFARYGASFAASYQEHNSAQEALRDIEILEPLSAPPAISVQCYRRKHDTQQTIRFKLYRAHEPVPLSHVLPILEKMGFEVFDEAAHAVERGDAKFWIHDFVMSQTKAQSLDLESTGKDIEDTFTAIWHGDAENDRFNRLSAEQGLGWRYVSLLRAFAHYRQQTGKGLSVLYMQDTLANHPVITRLMVDLFNVKFDPDLELKTKVRAQQAEEIHSRILEVLDEVESLAEDSILRQILNLINSLRRTNFFQKNASGGHKLYISLKISSRDIDDLPLPCPLTEIFVYSPRFEGIHLRWGLVARGGLRWSDRREDFRTEILGLAKAQQVKNAVIVPVGAKGGFVPKHLPAGGSREEIQTEGIICYRMFISGLLDLADNIIDGAIIKPTNSIIYDGDDPYLVVAADKGTATFSDTANEISQFYGFWLGDAFASGGSQGYDHKKMGITARGGWEAVKRHFRELSTDIQTQPFTAVGVGDMSGDVFGNGMLLSQHTRLIAAFDHRDIFLDPDPDPATTHAERSRIFDLPRSSWADYDKGLISQGGGIFSRSLKFISLTPEIKTALDITDDQLSPNELIQAILKAPADLLWFGGIGTYIKASHQRNAEVGDKANDAIRLNGADIRAKVIGEGANLGLTQSGRIEFARSGGLINTDAIDNAAGVDCSDHEVNIKILLGAVVNDGLLSEEERNELLQEMTDNVSELVLRNNYTQTLALSLATASAVEGLDSHRRSMQALERQDLLNREVEHLPNDEQLEELALAGEGLTSPELAVLMAYSKITLFDAIVNSTIPDGDDLAEDLKEYFPDKIQEKFVSYINSHQLRREIIATILASRVVNDGGITFINHTAEDTGASQALIVEGFIATEGAYRLPDIRQRINNLDNKIPAQVQAELHAELISLLQRQVLWFLRYGLTSSDDQGPSLTDTVKRYALGLSQIKSCLGECLSPYVAEQIEQKITAYKAQGIDSDLARDVALLEPLSAACDIVDVTSEADHDISSVTWVYFALGERLGLDQLREQAHTLRLSEHWERLAVRRIIDDLYHQQRILTDAVMSCADDDKLQQVLDLWMFEHQAVVERTSVLLAEMAVGGALTVAKLSLANSQVRELAALVTLKKNAA